MISEFKNILVPVDFSINTEIAVKKAVALVMGGNAVIHLLHVMQSLQVDTNYRGSFFNNDAAHRDAFKKLMEWKISIVERFPDIVVETHLLKGKTVQQQIILLAREVNPQLIIIGKHSYHNWFAFLNTVIPARLAKLTRCPVLTAKMGSLHNKIKSIVFPIQHLLPNRKTDMLILLAKRYRARIYLVIPGDRPPLEANALNNAFIETYRILKSQINCPIEHKILPGANLTKSALQFARIIGADMILLSPGEIASSTILHNLNITDRVRGDSKLEILSVQPHV
jgi:nucleotide-binding universal stress UspA family protein